MSNTKSMSQRAVEEFFRTLSDRDVSIANAVLAEKAVLTIPFALDGGIDPERVFQGKDAVLGYLTLVLENFKQAAVVDRQTFVTDENSTFTSRTKSMPYSTRSNCSAI